MKMDSVIGCVSCGKPALLVGDEAPRQFPACFWCLAERRPGAAQLFLDEVRTEERERVLSILEELYPQRLYTGADIVAFVQRRIREGAP